jgi:hypothetical protein
MDKFGSENPRIMVRGYEILTPISGEQEAKILNFYIRGKILKYYI